MMDVFISDTEDEFTDDLEYNDEFESMLQAAESQVGIPTFSSVATHGAPEPDRLSEFQADAAQRHATELRGEPIEVMDIEDAPEQLLSPFERFREHGKLSVSDLVGTVWCEVQYDYRLRTLPYLPPSKRPAVITSDKGKEIVVDKAKEEGRERIVRRGEKIHKRLEREIHPNEVVVTADTREDVWGLRFFNMLAAMEALITLGTCRELPVVGFVGDILVTGIIDELNRKPIHKATQAQPATTRSSRQTALTSFFSPTKPRPTEVEQRTRTHKVYVSDSKTRARDSLPRESDTLAGQLQCMMYKELLDAMLLATQTKDAHVQVRVPPGSEGVAPPDLANAVSVSDGSSALTGSLRPSTNPLSFDVLFTHLSLDSSVSFSDRFIVQTRPIVLGNGLRFGAGEARNLADMVAAWERYVLELGLGTPGSSSGTTRHVRSGTSGSQTRTKGKDRATGKADENAGRTETRLELVYRRAGPKRSEGRKKEGTRRRRRKHQQEAVAVDNAGIEKEETDGQETEIEEVDADIGGSGTTVDFAIKEEEDRLLHMAIRESLKADHSQQRYTDGTGGHRHGDFALNKTGSVSVEGIPLVDPPRASSSRALEAVANDAGHGDISVRPKSRLSDYHIDRTSDEEREEDELAWAVEMSLADAQVDDEPGEVSVPLSQRSAPSSPVKQVKEDTHMVDSDEDEPRSRSSSASPTPPPGTGTASGSIIGRHRFKHDIALLDRHLESVLQYWRGEREPIGVGVAETRRCGWCEFEDGCEWRAKKAQEDWERSRSSRRT